MQHLNNGFKNLQNGCSTHVKMLNSSKNVKKLTKPLKYNYKALNHMCFNKIQ